MRLEKSGRDGVRKVWLTDREIDDLRRHAASERDDLIIQLGAFVGLRAFEIRQPTPSDIKTTDNDHYRLFIKAGKDTSGSGGSPRDAYLPREVERDLRRFIRSKNIAPKARIISLSTKGIRDAIKRTARRTAEETGNDNFRYVSAHDLRRRFAQRLLVDQRMNPRVVMEIGGWSSYSAIEPYLNSPTEDVIDQEFSEVEL